MNGEKLEKLKFCPYCFQDEGVVEYIFEVATQKWKYFDAETRRFQDNFSRDDGIIVFCARCQNEILEKDIK